jgi:hypothetical protein
MSDSIPNFAEQFLVTRSLVLVAQKGSASMDKFLLWVLTGFGAGFTYLFGQTAKDGSTLTPVSNLNAVWPYFFAAVGVAVICRLLATVVGMSASVFQKAEKLCEPDSTANVYRFFQVYIDSMPDSICWAAARAAQQFLDGDLTSTGKQLFLIARIQFALTWVSMGLLGFGIYQGW